MITRFAVLPDERRVLLGIDKANVFEAGYVYEAFEILDEIVLRKVGKYSLPKNSKEGGYPNENNTNDEIIYYGRHLITEQEHKNMINDDIHRRGK